MYKKSHLYKISKWKAHLCYEGTGGNAGKLYNSYSIACHAAREEFSATYKAPVQQSNQVFGPG